MSRVRRASGPLIVAIVLAAAADPAWLDTLMQRMAAIPARQAGFVQEKRLAALNQPLISRGQLIYQRPSYFKMVTTEPQPETLIVSGNQAAVSLGNGGFHVVSLASQPEVAGMMDGIRAALAGDLGSLRQDYRIDPEGSLAAWRLTLTPTAAPLTQFLRSVTIEGSDTDVHTIEVLQINGDQQDLTITGKQ
jgi:outer membrane lipoprotein-sorting protein